MEKATCPIDQASARELEFTQDCEKAIRDQVPEEKPDIHEDGECDCGDTIPYQRLRLGYSSCVRCSDYEAKRSKQYNRRASRSYDYDD